MLKYKITNKKYDSVKDSIICGYGTPYYNDKAVKRKIIYLNRAKELNIFVKNKQRKAIDNVIIQYNYSFEFQRLVQDK